MNRNKEVFLNQNRILPTLYYDMVFVHSIRPVLFSCRDDASNVYLCCCHCSSGEKAEWIIAPTSCERLVQLLTDQITIRNAFSEGHSECFVATMRAGEPSAAVVESPLEAVDASLPTAGYYMEAEPGEFDEELVQLRAEVSRRAEFTQISFPNRFAVHTKRYRVHVIASKPAAVAQKEPCSTRRMSGRSKVRVLVR